MKKVIVLIALLGVFIFGATSVWGGLEQCNLGRHSMFRDGNTVHVSGNIWYDSDFWGSQWYYELNYVKSYYYRPVTTNWGDKGTRTDWIEAYSAIGEVLCWQEQIYGAYAGTGTFWSDSYATAKSSKAITTLYGGSARQDIWFASPKNA